MILGFPKKKKKFGFCFFFLRGGLLQTDDNCTQCATSTFTSSNSDVDSVTNLACLRMAANGGPGLSVQVAPCHESDGYL